MIELITRYFFVAAGAAAGLATTNAVDWQAQLGLSPSYVIFLFIILGGSIGYVVGGILGRELNSQLLRVEEHLGRLESVDVILMTIGLVLGMLVAFLAIQPLQRLEPEPLAVGLSVAVFILSSAVGTRLSMSRRAEFLIAFPRFATVSELVPRERMIVLDTSAVIDGRFVQLNRIGFFSSPPRVPRFVLGELHVLADSADDNKRARGRRGLDLLSTLPAQDGVTVLEVDYPDTPAVDDKLVRLCADSGALMLTVDYNLSKVAVVQGVKVLNLNELASALRTNLIAGDIVHIKITKPGKEQGQGVGYLEDGTMVVVAEGLSQVGKIVDVEVTSVLQTSAGRMVFARLSRVPASPSVLADAVSA